MLTKPGDLSLIPRTSEGRELVSTYLYISYTHTYKINEYIIVLLLRHCLVYRMKSRLALNSDPPASAFWVLGLR